MARSNSRNYKTDQEKFWAGKFGEEYVARNRGNNWIAANTALFAKVLAGTGKIGSVIEFGANIGLNLQALRVLLPEASLASVEINQKANTALKKNMKDVELFPVSILDFKTRRTWDMVLIKGVLIHINPDYLAKVYETLYRSSARYICIAEYYNPSPTTIPYRGHTDRLFKRDFAGEMLDRYPGLRLLNYGFGYHRDLHFPQDDITWFLLEKPAHS
ncbi:MAG TPA: pseudaminic acid biosynthesis-associated methylase [Candidatus Omnitrophota bacterium]|nr:pseudaminic acid biosynthesis-associated methylase [Candidatus Omnitrophota bacterium]